MSEKNIKVYYWERELKNGKCGTTGWSRQATDYELMAARLLQSREGGG